MRILDSGGRKFPDAGAEEGTERRVGMADAQPLACFVRLNYREER